MSPPTGPFRTQIFPAPRSRKHNHFDVGEAGKTQHARHHPAAAQTGDAALDDTRHHPRAIGKLLNERGGHFLHRAVDKQHVIRRAGRGTGIQRAADKGDAVDRDLRPALFLDGGDLRAQRREQRRAVPGRRADQQHLVALEDLRFLEQAARHQRRIERTPIRQRDRPVDIGHRPPLGRHEFLARHMRHRRDHALIIHIAGAKLAFDHGGPHR